MSSQKPNEHLTGLIKLLARIAVEDYIAELRASKPELDNQNELKQVKNTKRMKGKYIRKTKLNAKKP